MDINLTIIFILLICFGICFFFFRRYYLGLLKKETKRAQKSEQLKSVFIENVSHSLRTPLSAISGYCNMILDEKDEEIEPTQVREMVTRISDDSQQLLDFVSQLYNMSKFEGITPSFTFIEVNLTEPHGLLSPRDDEHHQARRDGAREHRPFAALQGHTRYKLHASAYDASADECCKSHHPGRHRHQIRNGAKGRHGTQGVHHLHGYRAGRGDRPTSTLTSRKRMC